MGAGKGWRERETFTLQVIAMYYSVSLILYRDLALFFVIARVGIKKLRGILRFHFPG